MPPLYKHDVTSRIIHSDTHSRTLSGEYAEIGPALSMSLERGYSLIGVAHTSLPPVPTELDPETDQIPNPGYENPYDLPMFSLAHKSRQTDILSSKSQEAGEGTNSGSQSLGSHEYHMLEQIAPLSSATSPLSAVSPHHTYHTLEDPNAHSRSCDIIDCSVPVASVSPDIDDNTIIVPQETFKSPRLSSSSVTTEPGGRLPTIPECETENQTTLERSDIVCPSRPSDTNSPDITAANRGGDCTGFSDSSTDDREYDKLVDPPHLYHILEHSPLPGCPRVCDFAPAVYDNLEAGHAVKRKANLLPHVHFLNPQAGVANLTYSSGSSLDASETNVFDDPQYLVSSPGRTRVVKLTCSADRRRELKRSHSYTHGRSPRLYPCQADTQDDTVSSKYSGDYERDPVYMQQLCNGCEERDQSNDLKIRRPPRVMDDSYFWQDDSGFSTFDGSRLSLQDREKGSSLPNLTKHIYQSLETETLEPLQPYDKLDKSRKETAT